MLTSPLNFSRWLTCIESMLQLLVNDFCLYKGEDYVIMVVGGLNDYHVNEMTSNRSGFLFNTRGK